jgi:hypothetical protein
MGYPGVVDELQKLILRAYDNDSEAAKAAHSFLVYLIQNFNEVCRKNPDIFKPIAKEFLEWPGFVSRVRVTNESNKELMDMLGLGKDVGLNFLKGKQPSTETLEIKVAIRLYGLVNIYRKSWTKEEIEFREKAVALAKKRLAILNKTIPPPKHTSWYNPATKRNFELQAQSRELSKNLQPLSRDNYKEWFKAALPAFLSSYGENDFEKRAVFKHYKNGTPGQKRDAIKKKIRQAFRSLAPQLG